METRTANKGEWSELYALMKLLLDGKLFPADDNLELIEDKFYPISKVITNADAENKITYTITSEEDISISKPTDENVVVIKRQSIKNFIEKFLNSLKEHHEARGAFSVTEAEDIMMLLNRSSISATSFQKADLILELYDSNIMRNTEHGYSLKSQVGGRSTLFNASRSTNILYEVTDITKEQMEKVNAEASPRKRVEKICAMGGKLNFVKNDSQVFTSNLTLVDSSFPRILAEAILIFNKTNARTVNDVIKLLPESNLTFDFTPSEEFYRHNFRKFLFYSALGMVAAKEWLGITTVDGGVIVVKRNGSLAGYNPSSLNRFQDYLLNNTVFDTPDTRNKFGELFEEDNKILMKLNFQVRFNS